MTAVQDAQLTEVERERLAIPRRKRWRDWMPYAAAVWSLAYGALGLYWALGGAGFPFGPENDPAAGESLLEHADAASGAPAIAVLGLVGAAVALTMARARVTGAARTVLLAFAAIVAITLLVVIPDRRVLVAAAYAPLFLIGAPFGWPEGSFRDAIPWPVINQFIVVAGGLLWAGAALAFAARTADVAAGIERRLGWTSPQSAGRWGRWATAIAVVIPLIYAATRWVWALGIPLGISEEFLREGQASGLWIAGAGLGTVAVMGAILTLGLVQPWGEVFPRWIPGLAGKRVPPALAIVPATVVAALVTSAGLAYVRVFIRQGFSTDEWAILGPELLWPFWGAALGAATLAYVFRRREPAKNALTASPNGMPPKGR